MTSPDDWPRLDAILEQLLDLAPAERPARLAELTEGDPELRARVEEILAKDEGSGGILDQPFDHLVADVMGSEEPAAGPGAAALADSPRYERIGPYRVIRVLGHGGMGEVLLAERDDGEFEQQVALKIVRYGLDREEIVERFRRERRLLARMRHPNIAAITDGGAAEDGVPYFAMEYVEGERITDWCDARRLGVKERVKLFESVCRAVQYAHRNLVIHRDIKPGNVFVTKDGAVKLLDFGIGKLINADGTAETQATHNFLTPGFAAPEQVRGEATSTSTDVFSLGVLLYVLLTGHPPFGDASGIVELARAVLEEDAPPPSTRTGLAASDVPGEELARRRGTSPDALRRGLQGDLDTIIGKAMRKEADDRYASVEDLRHDLERHRNSLPVEARPATTAYRLRKFVRRNRVGVAAASAILVAVVAGVAGVLWQAGVAEHERDRAEAALVDVENRARELQQVADFQAEQLREIDAQEMGERLRRLILEGTPIDQRPGLEERLSTLNFTDVALTTLQEDIFRRSIDAIDAQFAEQPVVQAKLLQTVAVALQDLGLLDLALDPQRRALEIRRAVLGDDHEDTLTSINNMGYQLSAQGDPEGTERYYRESMEGRRRVLGPDHRDTLASIANVATCLSDQGRTEEAEPYYREALGVARDTLGDDHEDTLALVGNLGLLLRLTGRLAEAEPFYLEALEGTRRELGDDDPQTCIALNNMGYLLKAQGKLEEAEPYYRQAIEGGRRTLGDGHPGTIVWASNLGGLLRDLGRLEEANALGVEAVGRFRANNPEGHWHIGVGLRQHSETLLAMDRFVEAEAEALEAHGILDAVFGAEHRRTVGAVEQLVKIYEAWHAADPEAVPDATRDSWKERLPSEDEANREP